MSKCYIVTGCGHCFLSKKNYSNNKLRCCLLKADVETDSVPSDCPLPDHSAESSEKVELNREMLEMLKKIKSGYDAYPLCHIDKYGRDCIDSIIAKAEEVL